jgi:hypothetical protein
MVGRALHDVQYVVRSSPPRPLSSLPMRTSRASLVLRFGRRGSRSKKHTKKTFGSSLAARYSDMASGQVAAPFARWGHGARHECDDEQGRVMTWRRWLAIFGVAGGLMRFAYGSPSQSIQLAQGDDVELATDAEVGVPPIDPRTCPLTHPIKGNFTTYSGESCIHHVPGGEFYDKTKPERCYATEQEARAGGCRRSTR